MPLITIHGCENLVFENQLIHSLFLFILKKRTNVLGQSIVRAVWPKIWLLRRRKTSYVLKKPPKILSFPFYVPNFEGGVGHIVTVGASVGVAFVSALSYELIDGF